MTEHGSLVHLTRDISDDATISCERTTSGSSPTTQQNTEQLQLDITNECESEILQLPPAFKSIQVFSPMSCLPPTQQNTETLPLDITNECEISQQPPSFNKIHVLPPISKSFTTNSLARTLPSKVHRQISLEETVIGFKSPTDNRVFHAYKSTTLDRNIGNKRLIVNGISNGCNNSEYQIPISYNEHPRLPLFNTFKSDSLPCPTLEENVIE